MPTGKRRTSSNSSSSSRCPGGVQTRLDLGKLDGSVERLFREGLAPSTRKTYGAGKKRYREFCSLLGRAPTPATEQQLCRFVARLEEEGLAHSTIKCYLAAVRHLHLEEGKADPNIGDMARLQLVVRGVKSSQAKEGAQGRLRLPISIILLRELKVAWTSQVNPEGRMLWAAASLCFFGFMRSGEITLPEGNTFDEATHLGVGDLAVDSKMAPTTLRVRLKVSKTDPFRKGVDVFVGKTGNDLCPVEAMLAYLRIRGWKPGPLFCSREGKQGSWQRYRRHSSAEANQPNVTQGIASGLEQQLQQLPGDWEKPQLKC